LGVRNDGALTLLTLASLAVTWEVREFAEKVVARGSGHYASKRIGTFSYFIPTALKLLRAETSSATRSAMAPLWMRLNWLRASLSLAGWLAALKALSLLGLTDASLCSSHRPSSLGGSDWRCRINKLTPHKEYVWLF
jgi:hypothetical protein